jgi:hypothetical protein
MIAKKSTQVLLMHRFMVPATIIWNDFFYFLSIDFMIDFIFSDAETTQMLLMFYLHEES